MLRGLLHVFAIAAVLCACAACSQSSGLLQDAAAPRLGGKAVPAATAPQAMPVSGFTSLPQPSALRGLPSAPRRASYAEADLSLNATAFAANLPKQNATVLAEDLSYTPSWSSAGDGPGSLAYSSFIFNVPGYDRAPLVRSVWDSPPADHSSVWLGLANWTTDRWDWYDSPASYIASLPSLTPYINFAGSLVLVVLRTGSDTSKLSSVRLAAPPPLAVLGATPASGAIPLDVTFDASASSAAEGTIIKYEFDRGNGTFIDKGATPTYSTQYTTNGRRNAQVRVTDSLGGQSIAGTAVLAVGAWNHTWGTQGYAQFFGTVVDQVTGNIYVCGSAYSPAFISSDSPTVWKYNAVGELLWVRAFPFFEGNFNAVCLDENGDLLLAGSCTPDTASRALVQKWTADGDLVWSRYLAVKQGSATAVMSTPGSIFVCGSITVASGGSDALLMRLDGTGELAWGKTWDSGGSADQLAAISLRQGLAVGSESLLAAGTAKDALTNVPLMLEYGLDGSLIRSWQLASLQGRLTGVQHIGTNAFTSHYQVCGYTESGSIEQFIQLTDNSGVGTSGLAWKPGAGVTVASSMAFIPSLGRWLLAGSTPGVSAYDASLLGMDMANSNIDPLLAYDDGTFANASFQCLAATPFGGALLAGKGANINPTEGSPGGSGAQLDESFIAISGTESVLADHTMSQTGGSVTAVDGGIIDNGGGNAVGLVMNKPLGP